MVSAKIKKGLVKLMNSLARPFLFAFMLVGRNRSDRICSDYSWGGTVSKCE